MNIVNHIFLSAACEYLKCHKFCVPCPEADGTDVVGGLQCPWLAAEVLTSGAKGAQNYFPILLLNYFIPRLQVFSCGEGRICFV